MAGAAVTGVYRNQALSSGNTEAAGVLAVHYDAARERHFAVLLWDCDRKLLPIQEVHANGMPPTHVAPFITERIELIEEVILLVKVNQAVRIVCPMIARREVHLMTVRLVLADDLGPRNRRRERVR